MTVFEKTTVYDTTGKGGEILLAHNGILFATAERFALKLIERAIGETVTGAELHLTLFGVAVSDELEAEKVARAITGGQIPHLGFQGVAKTRKGYSRRVVFRDILPVGDVDVVGLARGSVDLLGFHVNQPGESPETLKADIWG
jgi:hypothetical protein